VITLDHIAIASRDAAASARFLADILGIAPAKPDGADGDMFNLAIGESTCLLFSTAEAVAAQHMAFRVDEATFAEIVDRLRARGVRFGNDPEDVTNGRTDDPLGGRGRVYFLDPDGHLFEVAA
jgi:catechol 2,3-dioxygenase-like lactoylglutathione lyase family enzyme